MQTQTLVSHPKHEVSAVYPARASDTLVITFNPVRTGLSRVGFGAGFIQSMGFTHVSVSEAGDSQYQHLAPEELERALRPLTASHDRVFLYGSSLGGHAALYYANWLKARAVAISPRLPAHPYFRPFLTASDSRLGQMPLLHRDLPDIADPGLSPVVLYDPWTLADDSYVAQFVRPAFPDAWFIPVRGAGHRVARVLAYQQRLKPVLADILVSDRLPRLGYDLAARPRVDLTRALRALEAGRVDLAARWLFRVMRDPATPGLAEAIARYRSLTGRPLVQ